MVVIMIKLLGLLLLLLSTFWLGCAIRSTFDGLQHMSVCIPSTLTLYLSSSRMKLLVNVLRGILSCWMLLSSHEPLSSCGVGHGTAAAVQGTACKKTVGELQTRPAGHLEIWELL